MALLQMKGMHHDVVAMECCMVQRSPALRHKAALGDVFIPPPSASPYSLLQLKIC